MRFVSQYLVARIAEEGVQHTVSPAGTVVQMVVKPIVLTTVPVTSCMRVARSGTSISVIAMQVPSGHSNVVEVDCVVPTVSTLVMALVVVLVVRMGFVAIGTEF